MSETLIPLTTDPALLAEAVAWQHECGVFDVLSPDPVDAFALKDAPAPAVQGSQAPASRVGAGQGRVKAPSVAPPSPQPASRPSPQPASRPGQASQAPSKALRANQHGRRGLEAADDIAEAEKLAAACSTIDELRDAVAAFDGCLLKETASNTVFADGVEKPEVLVIGSAPGTEEDRQGVPFVGPRGQLLDAMLGQIGLDRAVNTRLTNIVFWRPPGDRDPNASEVALCWPFAKRHIELSQPKLILTLGGMALKTLVDPKLVINRERGKWKSFDAAGATIALMPTLHPKHLLRHPLNKREAWSDLLSFKKSLGETP